MSMERRSLKNPREVQVRKNLQEGMECVSKRETTRFWTTHRKMGGQDEPSEGEKESDRQNPTPPGKANDPEKANLESRRGNRRRHEPRATLTLTDPSVDL